MKVKTNYTNNIPSAPQRFSYRQQPTQPHSFARAWAQAWARPWEATGRQASKQMKQESDTRRTISSPSTYRGSSGRHRARRRGHGRRGIDGRGRTHCRVQGGAIALHGVVERARLSRGGECRRHSGGGERDGGGLAAGEGHRRCGSVACTHIKGSEMREAGGVT